MKAFIINKKESLPQSSALIEGELSAEAVVNERGKAIKRFQQKITLDGFRKGHVPEKILIDKVGELAIYEEAAAMALEHSYPEIIKECDIDAVGNPRISITKISPGNPVGFKIETALLPKIILPDYKNLSKETASQKEEVVVEEAEIERALDDMRRSYVHHQKHHSVGGDQAATVHDDHTGKDIPEEELPLLDDDFAKKLGGFETLAILKEKMKESISNEKKIKAIEKLRLSLMEKIIEKTELVVPDILVESELSRMLAEFRGNLERMGIGYDQYLIQIKKGEEEIRNEWRSEAEKRAKIQLILKQISIRENIKINEEEVEKEVTSILNQYKEADKKNAEAYVRNILANEMVWRLLEEGK